MAGKHVRVGRAQTQDQYGLRILNAIRKIIRAADLDSRQLASKHQITSPQLVSLMAIAESEPTTAVDVSRRVHLGASTMVGVLDRLEAKGLITRRRDSEDRRQIWVRATKAGHALVVNTPFPLQQSVARAYEKMKKQERIRVAACVERLVELMAVADFDSRPMLEIVGVHQDAEHGEA